jgi:hypothetical protein
MKGSIPKDEVDEAYESIWRELMRFFENANLGKVVPPPPQGTLHPRSFVHGEISLTADELRIGAIALEACHEEFTATQSGWIDFNMASPGDVWSHGVTHEDLLKLAAKLKQHMQTTE